MDAGFKVLPHGKNATAERGVTGRAMRDRGSGSRRGAPTPSGRTDIVSKHGVAADQIEAFVDRKVVVGPGEYFENLRDFVELLIDVGLKAQTRSLAQQRTGKPPASRRSLTEQSAG